MTLTDLFRKGLKHKEIYPLLGILGFAAGMTVFVAARACLVCPDVVWNHNNNPSPWLDIKQTEQKKLYHTHDYMSSRGELPKY